MDFHEAKKTTMVLKHLMMAGEKNNQNIVLTTEKRVQLSRKYSVSSRNTNVNQKILKYFGTCKFAVCISCYQSSSSHGRDQQQLIVLW